MEQPDSSMAKQIAQAAIAFVQRRAGRAPSKVTAVVTNDTLVITLHGILSPAETDLAKNPAGAAQFEELHRKLFDESSEEFLSEIQRITGYSVREANAEIEPTSGTVVKMFTTGTEVQVFRLAGQVPTDSWSGDATGAANINDQLGTNL
jgi:uncharacterized protein YbcI